MLLPGSYIFIRRSCIRHCTLIIAVLLLVTPILAAQQSLLKFDRITPEQGLSDNFINCMIQDSQGLIWFGTRDGLNRYDGYDFTIYRPDIRNPASISDGNIDCMIEDRQGNIWLGTHSGELNRFDPTEGTFLRFHHDPNDPASLTSGSITSLCEQEPYIWITTDGPGARLCKIDTRNGIVTRYHHSASEKASISSNNVASIVRDRFGTIWVATEDAGLNRFDPATGGFINGRSNPAYAVAATGPLSRLYADPNGKLWLWHHQSVRRLDPLTGEIRREEMMNRMVEKMKIGRIYAIHHDRHGLLWIGGSNGGVGILAQQESNSLQAVHNDYDPYSLSSNRIYSLMEDRSGNIWIGTDKGASKFNRRNWHPRYFQHDPLNPNTISNKVVRNIIKDRRGDLWIATEVGGINRIAAATGDVIRYRQRSSDPVMSMDETTNVIYEDSEGYIWAGTNNGLARLDPRTGGLRYYPHDRAHASNPSYSRVWPILEDREKKLWVGTFGGLCRLDRATGRFTYYPSGSGGPNNDVILSLYEDSTGNIWIGTEKGLSILDRTAGTWRHYVHKPGDSSSLSNNRIWYIHKDRNGLFWLATSGGGLNRFDPRTGIFRHYTEQNGLASNIVCGILEDDHGRLWVSTTRGISMLTPSTGIIRNYSLQDGFYLQEFHFKSCYRDNRGYFYFGGYDGIITFHPDSITDNLHRPDILLTSFKVFNRDRMLERGNTGAGEIRLTYDSNFFSFGFAALDFTNPRRNQYRYRLEGLDEQWRETDGRHPRADYTNLPPGRYMFHILGSNSDGIWNEQGISIALEIEPAYWQTWWFRGLAILFSGGMIAAAVRGHIRGIRRRGVLERKMVEYQLKALRAQMNPHFIFNSLNSILLFMLDHDTDAAHLYLTKFARLMRSTLEHSKSEAIPLADELDALRFYLELEALRFDNTFTYGIEIAPDIAPDEVMIPPMIIQPYAENAIMHGLKHRGPGGKLAIDIRLEHGSVLCSVTDNGIGREQAAAVSRHRRQRHRSRGMEVTRERLEILSSLSRQSYGLEVVDLTTTTGTPLGTQVNIRIPAGMQVISNRDQQEEPI